MLCYNQKSKTNKGDVMKNLRKIGIVVFVAIVLLTISNCVQAASDFDLEQLDFQEVLNLSLIHI